MRSPILIRGDRHNEASVMPGQPARQYTKDEDAAPAGVLPHGLCSLAQGARARFPGRKMSLVDGPFPETKQ